MIPFVMYESERGNIITEEYETTLLNGVCLNVSSPYVPLKLDV